MYLVPIFLLAGPLVFVHTISTFNFLSPFISGISYLASVPQGEVDAAIPGTLAPAGVGSVFPQTPAPASIDFSIPTYRFNPNSPNSFSTAGETGSTPDYGSSIEAFRPPAGDSQPQNYKCSLPTDIIMCCESHSSEEWVGCDFYAESKELCLHSTNIACCRVVPTLKPRVIKRASPLSSSNPKDYTCDDSPEYKPS